MLNLPAPSEAEGFQHLWRMPVINVRNKKGNILVIFLAAALVVSISALGYLFVQNKQLQDQKVQPLLPVQNSAPTNNFPVPAPVSTSASIVDPTANWKTYSNSKYGFSFKYPEGWFFIENLEKNIIRIDDKELAKFEDEMGMGPYYSGYISIEILGGSAPREVQITDPVGTKKCEGSAYCVQKVSSLLVGGKQGAKMLITPSSRQDGDYWYEIKISERRIKIGNGTQEQYKLQILDQILSTFKFL